MAEQENPAGDMLIALAETELPTPELEELAASFHRRGFASEEFRTDDLFAFRAPRPR